MQSSLLESEPLLHWLQTFHVEFPRSLASTQDVTSGRLFVQILDEIVKKPYDGPIISNADDPNSRLHNLVLVYKQLRAFYAESLRQMILLPPPDLIAISEDESLAVCIPHLRRLLLLLLGCVLQAPRKEEYISTIEMLPESVQTIIMQCFEELDRNSVSLDSLSREERKELERQAAGLVKLREEFYEQLCRRTMERNYLASLFNPQSDHHALSSPPGLNLPRDIKGNWEQARATISSLTNEVEERSQQTKALKRQLEQVESECSRLRHENAHLGRPSRTGANDAGLKELKEKLRESEKLESEVYRLRQQLNEMEFYKTRVQELRDDNSTLIEEKQRVEDMLSSSRRKEEDVIDRIVETQMKLETSLNERAADRRRIDELMEANTALEAALRTRPSAVVADSMADLHAASEATRPGFSLEAEMAVSKVTELELEIEALKMKLVETEKKVEEKEDKWKVLEMQKEKVAARRELAKERELVDKERMRAAEMDAKVAALLREKASLEQEMDSMRSGHEEHAMELEKRIEELSKQVMVLRRKGSKLAGAQFRDMEMTEMEHMHHSVLQLSSQVSRMKTTNKILRQSCDRLKEDVDKVVTLEEENERLKRENRELRRQLVSRETNNEQLEALRKKNLQLEIENKKLRRIIESLRKTLVQIDPNNRLKYHYITGL